MLTGLFLGAGASFDAGMPLVWELTAEIKRWLTPEKIRALNHGWCSQGGGYSEAVIEDFARLLTRDDLHYEAILGYLETQSRRQRSQQQEYHGLYSWLVELVYQLLYVRHVRNISYIERQARCYEGIRALSVTNSPLWIFSLNHDLIVEAVAAHFSIPICHGFGNDIVTLPTRDTSGNINGKIRAATLKSHDIENGAMYFPNPGQPGIHLLKIHGALDIFTFNDGDDLLKLIPADDNVSGVIETLRAANEELLYLAPKIPGGKVKVTNEIAYADELGEMQFLRRTLLAGAHKFDDHHHQVLPKSLLKHFKANLNFVTKLICVGYGFGDIHINAILKEWLEFHSDRHLEIVNPDAKGLPAFLLHLAPQVSIKSDSATNYFDSLAGIQRSGWGKLETKLLSYFRKRSMDKIMSVARKRH